MRSVALLVFVFVSCAYAKDDGFLSALEQKLEIKFADYAGYVSNWLEGFNDQHLGKTELGRFLHYDEMKTKLADTEKKSEGRGMKKMGMAMMPLIFHIGATSTWMLVTTVLTAKSLAVGLALLVFKIAVSSAKLASFFTQLKHSKHADHHDWAPPSWTPHDHHSEHPEHHGTISHHIPEWAPKAIPHYHDFKNNEIYDFKNNEIHDFKHNDIHDFKNHEFHDFKNHEFHDFKNNDIHDFKNHEFHDFKNHEFHDFKNNDIHDFKNHEFHDFKNNDIHDFKNQFHNEYNFKPHEYNDYKTNPTHDSFNGFGDGYHNDFNHFDGAKKKIDTKVG